MIKENTLCKKMKAVIYTRVSSDEQITNFSLSNQEEHCRVAGERLGYEIDRIFVEQGESAKTENRPELMKLLDYCHEHKKEIGSVLVYRFDRVARNTMSHLVVKAKLAEDAIKLESVTEPMEDNPTGRFMETLLAAMAQLENEIKGEKSRAGMRKRFLSGLCNKPPMGYETKEIDGQKRAVPGKYFDEIKKAWSILYTGTKSLTDMTKVINDLGIPISSQSTAKLFRNKFYCGYVRSRKYNEEVKGIHEPMIPEAMFYQIQGILSGKYKESVKRKVFNPCFPLRGIVQCTCGRFLVAANVKGRTKSYPKYWCPSNCIHSVPADTLQIMVKKRLSKIQPSQGLVNGCTLYLHAKYQAKRDRINAKKINAEKESLEQKRLLTELLKRDAEGMYPKEIVEAEVRRIKDKLMILDIVKNDALCNKYDIDGVTNFIKALFKDLVKAYEVSDYGQAKVLIGSIYPSGLMFDGKKLLNHSLGLGFEAILRFNSSKVALSAPRAYRIEPILAFFGDLLKVYPNYKTQFAYAK